LTGTRLTRLLGPSRIVKGTRIHLTRRAGGYRWEAEHPDARLWLFAQGLLNSQFSTIRAARRAFEAAAAISGPSMIPGARVILHRDGPGRYVTQDRWTVQLTCRRPWTWTLTSPTLRTFEAGTLGSARRIIADERRRARI